ncbi:DISP2 protein, partial [Amia calva]|nr:DISP2 protein [Amia calva]
MLSNATSCLGLTEGQVLESLHLLRQCAPYYHDGSLAPACAEKGKLGRCSSVPLQCKHSRAIYQILHFLVDKDFLGPQTIGYKVPSLKYSLLFLPVKKGDPMMNIYLDNLEGRDLTNGITTITGMDLGIKQKLFQYYLARDSVYPVLAVVTLFLTMAFYLRSLFLSAMSLAAVLGSLMSSYFFYKVAFRLTFFPFLNLTAVMILLGSCANQAFIFTDLWSLQLSQKPPASLERRVNRALQEVGYLILVSGLTSSAAFFSGYMSSITAVRCFAVYLGTATLISSLSSLVWLPCSLILRERYAVAAAAAAPAGKTCCALSPGGFWDTSSRKRCLFSLVRKLRGLRRGLTETSDLLFIKILPCGVVKFRYIWVCWFAVLAAGGTYITCIDPGMKLPSSESKAAQLFRSSHPFERYDAEYRHQFMFERLKSGEEKPMTIMLVWGVLPTDNGDHLNPKSNGSLVMDPEFNMSSPEAQSWLRELCLRIQNQSFYSPIATASEEEQGDSVCFVEQLLRWVSIRRCSESEDAYSLCCNDIPFPYLPDVFEHCLGMMVAEKQAAGSLFETGGPRFDPEGRPTALIFEFTTTHFYSYNYSQASNFYQEIEEWFLKEMSGAPPGLRKGWFVSQLALYDLQQCLSSETLVVIGFSVALVFALLLLTTWNILLSIYAAAAVGGSVFVTVGFLVLLEWQLSGLEALFISAAAGLSVDFAANYCVSYSLSPHSDRLGRVAHSLKRMGCPAAIGAGVYFCIGVIMLPATALLFRKLGIFLLLVKCVACGFATFFFQSLCCFFGPQKNCGQISWPCTTAGENNKESQEAGNLLSPCSAAGPGSSNSAANGAFGCGGRSRVRRSFGKGGEGGGHLCPSQQRQRQRQSGGGRESEQYELQPLACQLSDSFENSTCTSKLSNRPSVLSEEIQFRSLSPRRDLERMDTEDDDEELTSRHLKTCVPPPALQTSSPYKENTLRPVVVPPSEITQERLLCRRCRGQTGGMKHWNVSLSSSSSMEDIIISSQPPDGDHRRSLSMEGASSSPFERHPHRRLLSSQSQSSFEGLEDSNETCLSEVEPGPATPQPSAEAEVEPQPGHLNGKRDTLRLSLKETVFETASPGSGRGRTSQGELPVILPNSKPDLPDVWIKREGRAGDAS